ncbi:MAG: methyltransferase domain-containing protein [Anaerolineae bacterium]|nr:methyltransferase domain-containing protein [Anaerolineae bacterium]
MLYLAPMKRSTRYRGITRHVSANWPIFAVMYIGLVLVLLISGISLQKGWLSFVPLMLALGIVLVYFLGTSLWAAHKLHDLDGLRPYDVLFDMGQIKATDSIVYVDLGLRVAPLHLRRRLTTGKIIVVDVYNPQWTTGQALIRARAQAPQPPSDPRLVWQNGRFDLLPLPDKSVPFVMLDQILSQCWQEGDRVRLLKEAHRILTPNGRLLLAERIRTQTNWLVYGPGGARFKPVDYWQDLLQETGFIVRRQENLSGLIYCFRADNPSGSEARQLALALPI